MAGLLAALQRPDHQSALVEQTGDGGVAGSHPGLAGKDAERQQDLRHVPERTVGVLARAAHDRQHQLLGVGS
jgi:hypothetical protein